LRRGGVDSKPDKVIASIITEDGSEEDGGDDFLNVFNDVRSEFVGLICAPKSLLGILVRPPVI
jgi:hypothetical protein